MDINSISQTNFNGGFRFINLQSDVKAKLPTIVNKGKAIFENFENQGDVFLVTRNSYDEKILQFIKDNRLDFEFYPSINTSLMVQNQPQKLKLILDSIKEKPIKTISGIREALQKRTIQKIQNKSPEHVTKILKTLCIDNINPIECYKNGVRIIDKNFARTIYITPPSKHGMHYVKVKPFSSNILSNRYMMNSEGNILATFNNPDSLRIFEERFSKLFTKN